MKRAKPESETPKPKKPKKVKKEEPDPDLLDLSSLSELSSADELSSDEDLQPAKKAGPEPRYVESKLEQLEKSLSPELSSPQIISSTPSSKTEPKSSSASKETSYTSPTPASKSLTSICKIPASEKLTLVSQPSDVSPTVPKLALNLQPQVPIPKDPQPSVPLYIPPPMEDELIMDPPVMKEEKQIEPSKPPTTVTGVFSQHLSQQDEWSLLQRLEHSSKKLPHAACRYKRKLAVRRLKRNLGIKLFDMDTQIIQLLRTPKHALEPISKETIITPASNQQEDQTIGDQQHLLDKITFTPYTSSFASRLFGSIRQRKTITREEPWLSSWNGRKLRPFIRRDYQSKPKRMLLMGQIKACKGKPCKKGQDMSEVMPGESIDYVYFQKEHLGQVNQLLSRSFWEGIDVSESLLFPEFSIVALYKRHVIGCAFMTPEAYITYFAVDEGWGNASIGQ